MLALLLGRNYAKNCVSIIYKGLGARVFIVGFKISFVTGSDFSVELQISSSKLFSCRWTVKHWFLRAKCNWHACEAVRGVNEI